MKFYLMSLWVELIVASEDKETSWWRRGPTRVPPPRPGPPGTAPARPRHKGGSRVAGLTAYAAVEPGNSYAQVDLEIFFHKDPAALTNER